MLSVSDSYLHYGCTHASIYSSNEDMDTDMFHTCTVQNVMLVLQSSTSLLAAFHWTHVKNGQLPGMSACNSGKQRSNFSANHSWINKGKKTKTKPFYVWNARLVLVYFSGTCAVSAQLELQRVCADAFADLHVTSITNCFNRLGRHDLHIKYLQCVYDICCYIWTKI